MLVPLGVLPLATYVLVAYRMLPGPDAFAPVRLALVRAAVIVGGYAVLLVEVLSVFRALTLPAMLASWSLATLVALGAALRQYRKNRTNPAELLRKRWADLARAERVTVYALAVLVLAELV